MSKAPGSPPPSYRRRILLINRPFQARFCLFVSSWVLGLTLAYPFIIYGLFQGFLSRMAYDPLGPAAETIRTTRDEVITLLVGMQALYLAVILVLSLFLSHRIAGPIHKLRMFLRRAGQGDWDPTLRFRSRDYFQEVAADFNAAAERARKGEARWKGQVDQVLALVQRGTPEALAQATGILKGARDG